MTRAWIRAHLMGAVGKLCGQNPDWSQEIGLEYVPPPFAQILLIHLLHFHHASLTSRGGKGNTK